MDPDAVAKIIRANTSYSLYQEHYVIDMTLIDALADHFEAELGNECDAMGCDEEGHRSGHTWTFVRADWVRIASGG